MRLVRVARVIRMLLGQGFRNSTSMVVDPLIAFSRSPEEGV